MHFRSQDAKVKVVAIWQCNTAVTYNKFVWKKTNAEYIFYFLTLLLGITIYCVWIVLAPQNKEGVDAAFQLAELCLLNRNSLTVLILSKTIWHDFNSSGFASFNQKHHLSFHL